MESVAQQLQTHSKATQIQSNPEVEATQAKAVEIMAPENPERRAFIKAGLFSLGGLALAFNLPVVQKAHAAQQKAAKDKEGNPIEVRAWLQLSDTGEVVLIVPAAEMGQGSQTALAMIFADELGADLNKVSVKYPLNNPKYNNPIIGIQVTGGSTAVRGWWQPLSQTAATLREMIRHAAAHKWGVAVNECEVGVHKVLLKDSSGKVSNELGFEELIPELQQVSSVNNVTLKKPSEYRYIGKPVQRVDTAAKVDGSAQFGMDINLPGMLVATIAQSPVFGGTLDAYDEAAALAVKGVKGVVPLEGAIAVVATGYWQAKKGLDALQPSFTGGKTTNLNSAKIKQQLEAGLQKAGESVKAAKVAMSEVSHATNSVEALYEVPYLAHTTMEPMNATAWIHDDVCEVWAPTQNQTLAASLAADASLMQPSQVRIHTTYLGGGFGRRANADYVAQAVAIALEMDAPVKLIWSREEDIQHDFYRPAALTQFNVKTDDKGWPLAWQCKVVSDSVMASFSGGSATMIDNAMSEGLADQDYQIKNLQLDVVRENFNIPLGFWRSVGHSYTGFFMEGFINELALKANIDPFEYRYGMLKPESRTHQVLQRLHSFSDWPAKAANGQAKGMAVVHSFGSYVGQVVEAHIETSNGAKRIMVDKVYCVVDCGKVVNPEIVKRQMQGSIVYGLTAALFGEIEFTEGKAMANNFDDYPMLTMAQTPEIEVDIVSSQADPGGYGEPGLPPLAPALAAALTQLTGKTYRSLPIKV